MYIDCLGEGSRAYFACACAITQIRVQIRLLGVYLCSGLEVFSSFELTLNLGISHSD